MKKKELLKNRGTVKASVLVGDSKCKGLVVLSFLWFQACLFYFECMRKYQVKKKNRKIWHKEKGKKVNAPFYPLNLVDAYNLGVGNVDQANHFRLQYRIYYWLRNPKWWWAIFFWCYELALTNSLNYTRRPLLWTTSSLWDRLPYHGLTLIRIGQSIKRNEIPPLF